MTPIGQITLAELQAMIGRDAEDARLEFKVDIPVHKQRQREQATNNTHPPRDGWWTEKPISDYGRDRLLEEVVALANAQGGQLFLGIDEEPGTALAKAICPVPRVASLETRFRDCLLSCVEPRLPQAEVRAVETDSQGGGVLVVEVQPSRLGPHRVVGTLQIPIRRADKCTPMSMPEVHEMVLRNARRFDEVRATLTSRMESLAPAFRAFLGSGLSDAAVGGSEDSQIDVWLKQRALSAYAFRITICAHDDLGISRLETFDPLIPPKTCVADQMARGLVAHPEMTGFWPEFGHSERFLGGVRQRFSWENGHLEFTAAREGCVEQTIFLAGNPDQIILTPAAFAGYLGCCMGIYDQLRTLAGHSSMPSEVAINLLARGTIRVAKDPQVARITGGTLPPRSEFPRRTMADSKSCNDLLNASVQDLLDSGNARAALPTSFSYTPH